jgi:hypothetical protein
MHRIGHLFLMENPASRQDQKYPKNNWMTLTWKGNLTQQKLVATNQSI